MTFGDILFLFLNPFEAIRGVRDFLELGGNVLLMIMLVTLALWALIYERYSFFRGAFQNLVALRQAEWRARKEHKSWAAHRIRTMIISDARIKAEANLPYIKVLVALAPFLHVALPASHHLGELKKTGCSRQCKWGHLSKDLKVQMLRLVLTGFTRTALKRL